LDNNGNQQWFDSTESIKRTIQTTDGGYIGLGKTIFKLDANRTLQWSVSIDSFEVTSVGQISDGGYIVVGPKNNDTYTNIDYQIIKFNSIGNQQWEKTLGGTSDDEAYDVVQTSDGNFVIAGVSKSNDGDVSRHHGSNNNYDYWIVKLNNSGSLLWEKSLGGSSGDFATSISATSDCGVVVAGSSGSTDDDVTSHHGNGDYWIVKLDNNGSLKWQKCFGGSLTDFAYCINQTSDGGFIIADSTESSDGDIIGFHCCFTDGWIVKINSTGDMLWNMCYGGSGMDYFYSAQETSDGGFIASGTASSDDGDVSCQNEHWAWFIKLNPIATSNVEEVIEDSLSILPNPFSNKFTIEPNYPYRLYDLFGGKIDKYSLSDLPVGTYFLRTENGIIRKVVKI